MTRLRLSGEIEISTQKYPPFFIFGAKRSGTTLLRLMLNAHPELCLPDESHFLDPILKRISPDKDLTPRDLDTIQDCILHRGRFENWKTTAPELRMVFQSFASPVRLREVIETVFLCEARKHGKEHWGEKTPEYIGIAKGIARLFPEARFIFLTRDGRDVSMSLAARGWEGWTTYHRAKYWNNCVKTMLSVSAVKQEIVFVKYENLVSQSEQELRKLTEFLDITYASSMQSYHESYEQFTDVGKGVHTKLGRKPSPDDIYKWKGKLPFREQFIFEAVCYKNLQELGYEVSAFQPAAFSHRIGACYFALTGEISLVLYKVYRAIVPQQVKKKYKNSFMFRFLRKLVTSR
jgi:hypothetical protein